ncbi:MarR family winged helix-turn-helix transcriptional regulator [Lewinella sp. IMCC34183]|uniref:MarR family winged helix-turn-helix transcriptional regulator n=1 Tax=Lewinella sp. IMCC34183 TaxID=2248762 RepID=UPI0013003F18|nr:MarR family transcriptional regulator [Lewinella sp. IMCC34183]
MTRIINLENKRTEKLFGVSLPQVLCLHWLHLQPDYTTNATAIKDYLQLNASTVTGIIQRLEKRELIVRCPDTRDLRGIQISLTSQGLDLLNEFAESSHSLIGRLSASQIEQLEATIGLLVDGLDLDPTGENTPPPPF